jgi:hypothetical protein
VREGLDVDEQGLAYCRERRGGADDDERGGGREAQYPKAEGAELWDLIRGHLSSFSPSA